MGRRRFAGASAGEIHIGSDVNPATQERSGGDHHTLCAESPSFKGFGAEYRCSCLINYETGDSALDGLELRVFFDEASYCPAIKTPVALRARGPYSRSLATIEHPELERSHVRSAAYDSAQCVNFAYDGSLGDAANRRIARHLANGLEGARNERDGCAKPGSGDGSFSACVAGTDDYYIEGGLKVWHGSIDSPKCMGSRSLRGFESVC
jgi:hypothetical protein